MTIDQKIRAIMTATGWKQQKLAEVLKVSQSTVNRWLSGSEPEGHRRDAINELFDQVVAHAPRETSTFTVPLMGYVGAGAEVEPDFEQVPPEGLEQVHVPFQLPDDMIAFMVRGDSMLPMFEDGMVIIVFREQRRPLESFYGERAVVRTIDGRRFVKTIIKGEDGRVSLLSWNAQPIQDVELTWIGEIFTFFPASAIRRESRRIERRGGIQGQLLKSP
ncbi:helix-turn-helix domain-containing protein [Nitratireductor sp. GCM10026969]|uniref:helix-turn-helix domain-containing protein n=1 Tax=Nitratireductor sp. GCM10026969 TaxID=3252645 RepID=UPI0036078C04